MTYLERENLVCEVADNFQQGMAMMESFDYDCVCWVKSGCTDCVMDTIIRALFISVNRKVSVLLPDTHG